MCLVKVLKLIGGAELLRSAESGILAPMQSNSQPRL